MRKVCSVLIVLAMVMALSSVAVYAEPAIIGSHNGSVGATGNWDGDVPKEAEGDSLLISDSGDAYGFVFENVPAGVYKIAHYIDAEVLDTGKQMRISPKVTMGGREVRCWIDWRCSDVVEVLYDEIDDEYGKYIIVSVINVPEDAERIDVGCWQDAGAVQGKLDKVVLATADYDFKDTEYVLIGENNYGSSSFGEDPNKDLLAEEGSWVESTSYSDAMAELNPPTPTPEATPTPESTPTSTVEPTDVPSEAPVTSAPAQTTNAPTASASQEPAPQNDSFPVWIIVVIVVVVAAAVGCGVYFLVIKKKK